MNGDQFNQVDDRKVYGWNGKWARADTVFGLPMTNSLGWDFRQDRLSPVALYSTIQRERLSTTREDNVRETSYALESLEHWLSEHPKGMARTREALSKAIRLYLARGARGLNPLFWVSWLVFFPRKVADRMGVTGNPEWGESLRLLYWTILAGGVVLFIIFFIRR